VLEYGLRVLAAGATCVARNASRAELLAAVYLVARGERMFMSADGERVQRRYPSGAPILTRRESDVFRCLSEGKSHAETACDLGIGVRTVHTYAARVYRKLNVRSKRELIAMLPPSDPGRD
jgi:DNA-binding NarL/FixJ family response regulator